MTPALIFKRLPRMCGAALSYLLLALVLAACGGSSGPSAPAPDDTPVAAVPSPSMELLGADAIAESITSGQTYAFTLKINNTGTQPLLVVMDWGDGSERNTLAFWPGESTQTYAKVFESSTTQSFEWQAKLLGAADEELGHLSGTVEVVPLPSPPALQLSNSPPSGLTTGTPYTMSFKATDVDADLASIEVKWADQTNAESQAMTGSLAEANFARNFSQAGTFRWTAIVRDSGGLQSTQITRSVVVTLAVQPPAPSAPTLTLATTPASNVFTQTAYELSFNAADNDGDLKALALRWTDESVDRTQTISTASASGIKFSRSFTQAGTFSWTARALDAGGRTSTNRTGQVVVSLPPPADDFPLPAARTLDSVPLLAAQECTGAQNGFFTMPAPDPQVEKRRRYVFDQFLVAKADKTGYDAKLTHQKWMAYEKSEGKQLYEFFHSFGLIALMLNQGKLSTDLAVQADWYRYANILARESVGNVQYEPFQRYQLMDTFMRWRCVMEPATESLIRNHMVARPFGGRYGTANLKILNAYTRYLTGLAWPDATLPNMLEADPTGIKMLKQEALDAYKYTSGEWASQPYDGYNTFVYMSLAQLSPDRSLATVSHLAFQAAMAKTASVWMKGILSTYSLRDYPPFKSGPAGAYASHWFFLGGKIPSFTLSRAYLVGAAVNYALPPEILRIATDTSAEIDTRLMLYAGGSKVHTHSYVNKDFGVFSVRSATRDGTGSTFTPGQTTPPGVVWSPKMGRANFWLTLTEDTALTEPGKGWTNSTTNLVHAKRGQQWLQHKGTLLMVTDNREGQLAADKPTLHQIIGSMPDPNTASMVDTSCAQTSCQQSADGQPVYQLFFARDNKVLIALTSSRPFTMFSKRTTDPTKDWQNTHGFSIPLDFSQSLAAGVAIEAAEYATAPGTTTEDKLAGYKKLVTEKSSFQFVLPVNDKRRSALHYTDRLGTKLSKEYIWQGNAPFWRTRGWISSSNPDPRPLEFINDVPVDHTLWPATDNRLVFQSTAALAACPLYVRRTNNAGWLKIWDDLSQPFTPNSSCKAPA